MDVTCMRYGCKIFDKGHTHYAYMERQTLWITASYANWAVTFQ